MRASARGLQFSSADTIRWLWSYYGSRLPGLRWLENTRHCVQIAVPDEAGKKRGLFIRNNGFDWDVVDELFLRHMYRVDLAGVTRILDLGGNIGLATVAFAWDHPQAEICTVEPIPDNLAVLRRNLELNRVPGRVVAGAVGPQDGQTRFTLSVDPRQHSASMATRPTGKTLDVQVFSIPTLMSMMGWQQIDLLKIDVEGAEREVLGGQPSWLKSVRCLIGEGHFEVGYTIEACRKDLEPLGFDVREIERNEGAMVFLARRPD
jgi:FkbM family methyltransferase